MIVTKTRRGTSSVYTLVIPNPGQSDRTSPAILPPTPATVDRTGPATVDPQKTVERQYKAARVPREVVDNGAAAHA